ncbi:DUF2236 domain-containing protein [Gordonia sp. TBRC 11910]|uniref:DUF2236 domain-containing protein n=1 Tax=Gordonia asplenii TaxID=2725283 RepID=A0A848KVX7_9ACTN|nr:oxygenase MpaB family protein [Gordonia asplenii]NMO02730.1 DUF2236 domain-containing protein [Gordonia asplenii]
MRIPFRRRNVPPTTIPESTTALFFGMGVANIIMQLALPGVGRGVFESRVDSGSAYRRVIKRQRTTGQYLAVAIIGSESDKLAYRSAVREVHSHVHSTPDSPVHYSGNDPKMQLWVAMCLFKGFLDSWELTYGTLDAATRNQLLAQGKSLGTTLEVRDSQWPTTFDEFERLWAATLPELAIDDDVRAHLTSLADLSFLHAQWGPAGRLMSLALGRQLMFMTRATLPPEFRELMGWTWSERDQQKFERAVQLHRAVDFVAPWLSPASLHAYLVDLHVRQALGLPTLGKLHVRE